MKRTRRSQHHRRAYPWGRLIAVVLLIGLILATTVYRLHLDQAVRHEPRQIQQKKNTAKRPLKKAAKKKQGSAPEIPLAFDEPTTAQVREKLNQVDYSGTALVVNHGQVAALATRGLAVADKHVKNQPNTMFEIDSVQKSLTGGLVMQQIDAGKLSFNTRLSQFYPQLKHGQDITIRQLLAMSSGLMQEKTYKGTPGAVTDQAAVTNLIKHLEYVPAWHGQWHYEPCNFNLLAGILEQVTGQSYQQLFTRFYINRLHLHHTRFAYDTATPQMAQGYMWNAKRAVLTYDQPKQVATFQERAEFGTGQVFMSTEDLYKAESSLLNGTLLTRRQAKILFQPLGSRYYSGGLYNQPAFKVANGYGYGYQCFLRISPDGREAVVMMSNMQSNPTYHDVAGELAMQYVNER